MITKTAEFHEIVRQNIAPIYFYEENNSIPAQGTMTFYRSQKGRVYGITNNHVYLPYKERKERGKNLILKIGNYQINDIKKRILSEELEHKSDLIVFEFYDEELKKVGNKVGFRRLFCINELFSKCANQFESNDTPIHFAGFQNKTIQPTSSPVIFEIIFDIFLSKCQVSVVRDNITLKFVYTREAIESGHIEPEIGVLPNDPIDFRGISGCPVFSRVQAYGNEITLLGIVYEGCDGNNSLEICQAKPITLLKHILETN